MTHRGRFLCQTCEQQRMCKDVRLTPSRVWYSIERKQKSGQLLFMPGLCYYSVDCDSALPCCSADQWVSSGQTNSTNVVNLGSLIVYVAFTVWLNRWMNAVRQSCWVNHDGQVEVFSRKYGAYFLEGCDGDFLFANRQGPLIRSYQLSF